MGTQRRKSFAEFLRTHAEDFSSDARDLAVGFVEGFEAAPIARMSAAAVAGATLDPSDQYALPDGYAGMINALAAEVARAGAEVHRRAIVRAIAWKAGSVAVHAGRNTFAARTVVITLPLGVLQAKFGERGAVRFEPRLVEKEKLIAKMPMGHVTRLTLTSSRSAGR